MPRREKGSFEQKLSSVNDYLEGKKSMNQIAKDNDVDFHTAKQWVTLYQSLGTNGLICQSRNTSYSIELKFKAVQDYLAGTGSLFCICKKYGIRSTRQLRDWLMKYNSHEKIKSSGTGGKLIMTKGRSTTFEERVEIVKYCIEHNKNYNETAEKFQVSYQQIRNWAVKYDEKGLDALLDRRGRSKSEDELTEVEKLKAQNKLLEAQNKRLEMENAFLKKLEEVERRRS